MAEKRNLTLCPNPNRCAVPMTRGIGNVTSRFHVLLAMVPPTRGIVAFRSLK